MNKKESSPIFIVVVFLLIIVAFFALSNVKDSKKDNSIIPINDNDSITKESEAKMESLSDYIRVGEEKSISFNEIVVSNPNISNGTLSFTVYSEKDLDLSNLDYYVEFYRDKKEFLTRRIIKGNILGKVDTTISIDDINLTSDIYIAISHISEKSIPKIKFSTDESGISGVICSKGDTTYDYDFIDDHLIRAVKKVSYKDNDLERFSTKLFETRKEANKLNEQKGITASVVESNREFIYMIEINYEEKAENKIDQFFYSKDEFNYIILFKMNAEGFVCT